jgi:hypothetical protein
MSCRGATYRTIVALEWLPTNHAGATMSRPYEMGDVTGRVATSARFDSLANGSIFRWLIISRRSVMTKKLQM